MTILKVKSGRFASTVSLPGSKSYANRMLLLAAVSPGAFTIKNLPQSSDVTLLANALKRIGLSLSWNEGDLTISNSFPSCEKAGADIEVGEGGTTARFLAAMIVLGKKPYNLILGDRLRERPWDEFITYVQRHGGVAELVGSRLKLQGPLKLPASVKIDCARTTQFASGICLALSGSETKVIPVNMDSSQSYWEMTEKLVETAQHEDSFNVPPDWSSASYPLAFGALNHSIYFPGLCYDKFQSDSKFFNVLNDFSAIEVIEGGMKVKPITEHKAVRMDVSDCLDLVPTLGFFLSHIKEEHCLSGIKNLTYKESNRIIEVEKLLSLFGRKAYVEAGNLIIQGNSSKVEKEIELNLPDDHRMVMAGSLFLRHHYGGSVFPAEAVNKSYPEFFKLFE